MDEEVVVYIIFYKITPYRRQERYIYVQCACEAQAQGILEDVNDEWRGHVVSHDAIHGLKMHLDDAFKNNFELDLVGVEPLSDENRPWCIEGTAVVVDDY